MSPVFDCTTEQGRAEGVAAAVEAVRAGEVVVLPTDTVYGVGADAFSVEAVAAVLAAKGRGREMPPPVLVPSHRTVDGLATAVPAWARDLMRELWPGPLTLVFHAPSSLMWDLGDTNGTVALRMPRGRHRPRGAVRGRSDGGHQRQRHRFSRPPPPCWRRRPSSAVRSRSTSTAARPEGARRRPSWTAPPRRR